MLDVFLTTSHIQETHRGVYAVRCKTPHGFLTVLPHHAPLLAVVEPGDVSFTMQDGTTLSRKLESPGMLKVSGETITIVS